MTNTKAYIFDYGGTLDTGGCHWGQMIWHAYEHQHVPVTEEQFREAYVYGERTLGKNPIIQSDYTFHRTLEVKLRIQMEQLREWGYWNAEEQQFHEKSKAVLEDLYNKVKSETARSRRVLEQLKRQGCRLVLVSNFYGNIHVVLREFGFEGLFEHVVESAVVGVRKPNARIFTMGVDALALPAEQITVVGDSITKDIEPGKKAGCHTIWLKGEGWTTNSGDEKLPDETITDIEDLLKETNIKN